MHRYPISIEYFAMFYGWREQTMEINCHWKWVCLCIRYASYFKVPRKCAQRKMFTWVAYKQCHYMPICLTLRKHPPPVLHHTHKWKHPKRLGEVWDVYEYLSSQLRIHKGGFGLLLSGGRGSCGAGLTRLVGWASCRAWLAACKKRGWPWFLGNRFCFRFMGA